MNKAKLISTLGNVPGVSHVLRWAANRFPEGSVVPIRSGIAQGMLWKRSHRYVNGYWLGHFEQPVQAALARHLAPGDTCFDVGANAGLFSLIALRSVGPTGKVVSVDPDPHNRQNMDDLAELNHLANWVRVQKAVAEQPGTLKFAVSNPSSSMGHLATDANETGHVFDVDVTTIDALVEQHGGPRIIKMDIEGAEVRALQGAARTLRETRCAWLIELHSDELARQVHQLLTPLGYRFFSLNGTRIQDAQPLDHHVIAQV